MRMGNGSRKRKRTRDGEMNVTRGTSFPLFMMILPSLSFPHPYFIDVISILSQYAWMLLQDI